MKKGKQIVANLPKVQWGFTAHADSNTIKRGPFDSRDDAEAEAERCMRIGIWNDRRLLPPGAIVFIELVENYVPATA